MKKKWCVLFFICFALVLFQLNIARANDNVEISKRGDFATDDKSFGKNENIYIKIDLQDAEKLQPGDTQLNISIGKIRKKSVKLKVPITIEQPKTEISYKNDIQPLFTQDRAWFDRPVEFASWACIRCHSGDVNNDGEEECPPECHLMNLGTHEGMLAGADGGSEPILGEEFVGAVNFNWHGSELRKRLSDNRMPPGWEFRVDESNRNGPDVSTTNDGNDIQLAGSDFFIKVDSSGNYEYSCCDDPNPNATGLIGTWVDETDAGLDDGNGASYEGDKDVTWSDVAPFFNQTGAWFAGSIACINCHAGDANGDGEETCPNECHLMDLSSAEGIRNGADDGIEPLLGESSVGETNFSWNRSELKSRLRDNRMPPNSPFVIDESNNDGRTVTHPVTGKLVNAVDLIEEWLNAGAPDDSKGAVTKPIPVDGPAPGEGGGSGSGSGSGAARSEDESTKQPLRIFY